MRFDSKRGIRILFLGLILAACLGGGRALAASAGHESGLPDTVSSDAGTGVSAAASEGGQTGSEGSSQVQSSDGQGEPETQKLSETEKEPESGTQTAPVSAPVKPGRVKVSISSHSSRAYLTWKKADHAAVYDVYRKQSGGKGYTLIGQTKKLKYTDKKVTAGKTYSYQVQAVSQAGGQSVKGSKSKAAKILICAINPKKKMIALTFDDGPGPYTKAIVKCLKKYGMHATFFVVGNRVDSYKSALKAAAQAGCEIGNHSWNHANLATLSASDIRSQISKTNKAVKAVTGKKPVLVRPPYGSVSSRVKKNVKMPMINWSVDTLDWKTRSKKATVSSVMKNAKDGQIVLMHDIHSPTKSAALSIIPKLVKKGYQLVTVSELARYKGKSLKKGKVYNSIR